MKKLPLLFLIFANTSLFPIQIGDDAPIFNVQDQEGFFHNLSSQRGKFVALFFFSKHFTFQLKQKISSLDEIVRDETSEKLVVYGVCKDTIGNQLKFYDQMKISYDLLADTTGDLINTYNASSILGVKPLVVLIGPDGRVFRRYNNISMFLSDKSIINYIINN